MVSLAPYCEILHVRLQDGRLAEQHQQALPRFCALEPGERVATGFGCIGCGIQVLEEEPRAIALELDRALLTEQAERGDAVLLLDRAAFVGVP